MSRYFFAQTPTNTISSRLQARTLDGKSHRPRLHPPQSSSLHCRTAIRQVSDINCNGLIKSMTVEAWIDRRQKRLRNKATERRPY